MQEVIQLHIDYGPVYALDGRGVTNGTLDTFTRSSSVATVNTPQTDLANDNGMLTTRSWCLNIFYSCGENLDILCEREQSNKIQGITNKRSEKDTNH